MAKIGIVTFHSALNYGAVLQCLSTVEWLRSQGHQPFVLDYRPAAMRFHPFRWDAGRWQAEGLPYLLKWLPTSLRRLQRKALFGRFCRRNLPLVPFSEAGNMDLILLGGDQIWNPALTGGPDPVYTGDFLPHLPKLAWSASCGKTLPDSSALTPCLERLQAVSVREEALERMIPGSVQLPDPALLLSAERWKQRVHPVSGPYVLAFPMSEDAKVLDLAREKARELGVPLKILSQRASLQRDRIQGAGPDDFLSLVCGAAQVVTSSFHGALFARIFDRPLTLVAADGDPRFQGFDSFSCADAQARALEFIHPFLP